MHSPNESAHTPSPWWVIPAEGFDPDKHIVIAEANDICVVTDRRAFDKTQVPANLQLVAAAPDLLDACRAILGVNSEIGLAVAFEKTRDAIEKATCAYLPDARFALTPAALAALGADGAVR